MSICPRRREFIAGLGGAGNRACAASACCRGSSGRRGPARLAYTSKIGGINPTVPRLTAELSDAEYDLDQSITKASTSEFVTQLALRPRMYVIPAPLRPVMAFVHTDNADKALGAAFQQNALRRVRAGDEAEIAFDAVPGRVFKGEARDVLDAIAAGQFLATGALQDFGAATQGGRALALIDILDDISEYQIPLGAATQVATYTEYWHHVALIRRILLRMRSWRNFIFMEGH
jgi:multidrug resistance efflux pump